MKVTELKQLLRQLTELYFTNAVVTFSKQSFVAKPASPLVTITTGAVTRPMNPPQKLIDGHPVSFYPASMQVQIDLFTNGSQVDSAPGYTPIVENTAEDEMIAFASFLNSPFVVTWCNVNNIALLVPNVVQDLSGVIHDTNYEFRAMLEITVYFTMEAIGFTGTLGPDSIKHVGTGPDGEPYQWFGGDVQDDDVKIVPVGSGENPEAVAQEVGYFTNVEINEKPVKEEDAP